MADCEIAGPSSIADGVANVLRRLPKTHRVLCKNPMVETQNIASDNSEVILMRTLCN